MTAAFAFAPYRAATALAWHDELDPADRALAELAGGRLQEQPDRVAEIARSLGSPHSSSNAPLRTRARAARARLLAPERIAREFERGELEDLEGWVLARSEADLALYLASLEAA